jgi:hypothetical protein
LTEDAQAARKVEQASEPAPHPPLETAHPPLQTQAVSASTSLYAADARRKLLAAAKLNNIAPLRLTTEPDGSVNFLGIDLDSLALDAPPGGQQVLRVAYATNPERTQGVTGYDIAYFCNERQVIDLATNVSADIPRTPPGTKLAQQHPYSVGYAVLCEGIDPFQEDEWNTTPVGAYSQVTR